MKLTLKNAACGIAGGVFTLAVVCAPVSDGEGGASLPQRQPLAFAAQTPAKPSPTPQDVARWIEADPPTGDDLQGAQQSDHEWRVTRIGGKIMAVSETFFLRDTTPLPFDFEPQPVGSEPVVVKGRAEREASRTVRVADGWLLSSDWAEWGGNIRWYAPSGTRNRKIFDGNVGAFVRGPKNELLALYGLSDKEVSKGGVLRLVAVPKGGSVKPGAKTTASPWRTEVLADLKERAYAAVKEPDGALLVATHTRLVRIGKKPGVENVVEKAFWGDLHPTSIARDDAGRLYIGMRHGVARVTLGAGGTGGTVRWLVPDKTFLHPGAAPPADAGGDAPPPAGRNR